MSLKTSNTLRIAVALALTTPTWMANAQETSGELVAQADTAAAAVLEGGQPEELVVTGSRIARSDGYEAPTPLAVVDSQALAQTADASVSQKLNTMPAFGGSLTVASGARTPSSNTAGIAGVALRNLGGNRTLVLLDGQRSVSATSTGIVDTNNFPQQLIARVETVTGGASAVYGSDAVAGVVNFVLDRKYTGFKGEASAGETEYSDGKNWKVQLAGGFPFAEGRGHVLLSGEMMDDDGVHGSGGRGWVASTRNYYVNPNYNGTNGQPEFLLANNVFLSAATPGGIITSGPLRGTAFGEGGVPYQFNYGAGVARDNFMSGGDYLDTLSHESYSLAPSEKRQNIFSRVSYDITDRLNVFAQVSRGVSETWGIAFPHYQVGAGPTVRSGNPFIPASVQAQMTALGLSTIRIGTMNADMGDIPVGTTRAANRFVVGAEGKLDLFKTDWSWNFYGQLGDTNSDYDTYNVENNARYALALDAVRDPVTGNPVCRSTLTDPSNGCLPWNAMGIGVNSDAARAYLFGTAHANQTTKQTVYAASITGEPFSNWAGPVSFALSAEYREEEATVTSDPVSQVGGWRSGNLIPLDAGYHVAEAAIETLVPLASALPFIDSWDLSAAFRTTDYEISGKVETWKVGMTYAPIPEVRFRGTVSRDIRAPNINELFQELNIGLTSTFDPETNTTPTHGRTQRGNLGLTPEKADSLTIGVVFQPSFAPGLSLSVDYWDIEVKDAITLIGGSQIINLCYNGRPDLCPKITRVNGVITTVEQGNYNMAQQEVSGIDFEASYALPLDTLVSSWKGDMSFRLSGTHYQKNITDDGLTLPDDSVGTTTQPATIINATLGYTLDRFQASLTARGFSSSVIDNDYIVCQTNCPASTTFERTMDRMDVEGAVYYDASLSYRFNQFDIGEGRVFLNVRNLLGTDPELIPAIGTTGLPYIYSRSGGRFDLLGRIIRAGVSFKF
jgi:iron complex outermembrane receptor protein